MFELTQERQEEQEMSTKIYDAYIIRGTTDMEEIEKLTGDAISNAQCLLRERYLVKLYAECNRISDIAGCLGKETVKELISRGALGEEYSHVIASIGKRVIGMADALWHRSRKTDLPKYLKGHISMHLYPHEGDTLVLFFGDSEAMNVITDALVPDVMQDYHYQNQTDIPEGISEKEYEERRKAWDSVLGADGVPALHGFVKDIVSQVHEDRFIFERRLVRDPERLNAEIADCTGDEDARTAQVLKTAELCRREGLETDTDADAVRNALGPLILLDVSSDSEH